jgi:hypothetical protein
LFADQASAPWGSPGDPARKRRYLADLVTTIDAEGAFDLAACRSPIRHRR